MAGLISAVSGIFGIISGIRGLSSKKESKAPTPIAPPQAPTQAQAKETATETAQDKIRRLSVTDKTRGKALVPEVNVGKKSLLGE